MYKKLHNFYGFPGLTNVLLYLTFTLFTSGVQANNLLLTCPADLVVQAPGGACGVQVSFDTLHFTSNATLVDTIYFPASGSFFEIGNTIVILSVTDVNGNIENCAFNLTITEFNGGVAACQALVNLSLQEQCQAEIQASQIVNLNIVGCVENFQLYRLSPSGAVLPPVVTANDFGTPFQVQAVNLYTGASCTSQATLTGGLPPAITCPPGIMIFCNEPTDSSNTGTPALSGCFQNVQLTYSDVLTAFGCPDSMAFQIKRKWISTDPFGNKDTCNQLVTARKLNILNVEFPPDYDGLEEPPLICSDTLTLQELSDPDNTGFPTIHGYSPAASTHCKMAVSRQDFTSNPCGAHYEVTRVWKVIKTCSPSVTLTDTQFISIVDWAGPDIVVPDTIFASTSSNCGDSLLLPPANVVFECSDYDIEIITPWDTLTTNGGLTPIEQTPGTWQVSYTFTDDCNNVTQKTATLLIDDEVLQSCPPDIKVTCDYYFDTLALALISGDKAILEQIGNPVFYGNCFFETEEMDSIGVNSCGSGQIKRTITTVGVTPPVTCIQYITVEHVSDFEAAFPADTSLCSTNLALAGTPEVFNHTCEEMSVEKTDQVIQSGLAGCFTVNRKWTVINNCIFTGNILHDDVLTGTRRYKDGGDGYIEYFQVIHVNNGAKPTFPNGCSISNVNITGNNCTTTVTLPVPQVTGCNGAPVLSVSGTLNFQPGSPVTVSPGTYNVTYKATDACGNMGTCAAQFQVIDASPPAAVCKLALVFDLPEAPSTVHVAPIQLNNGSSDNCQPLLYSFSANVNDNTRTFGCGDLGQFQLQLRVTDVAGAQAFCETTITIKDPGEHCLPDNYIVSGNIRTETQHAVGQVIVSAGAGNTVTTGNNGFYQFTLQAGSNVTISPSKNINLLNGVTTFDLVQIRKHILGTELLNSPYKVIAADANKSGSVTTADLVVLQQLILGMTTTLPNGNTSWRFVRSEYIFPNPQNPFTPPFPEVFQINNLSGDFLNVNFTGIKTGDVNGSANPANMLSDDEN